MIIALAGNQNCGKTTLFNQLTGSNQRVGNFPGITVEHKEGVVKGHPQMNIVDLPGIYSLSPYTDEEIVTRDFLMRRDIDLILNIVDVNNIDRNLYLTLQMLEMDKPMVVALNMMDELASNGGTVNIHELSKELGVPVVPIVALRGEGIVHLIETILETEEKREKPKIKDFCKGAVHRALNSISALIDDHAIVLGTSSRFAATKVAEGDKKMIEDLRLSHDEMEAIEHTILEMESKMVTDRKSVIVDMRYNFIEKTVAKTVTKPKESKQHVRSIKIDKVLTHKYFAIPIFLGIMFTIFWLTFGSVGAFLSDCFMQVITLFTEMVSDALVSYGLNPLVHDLVINAVFQGVGSVLSFIPTIVTLFFFLSILEDSGYMPRVAFVMDKLLRKIGLSGRSFVPMLIGFGCSVPAIMATKTLSSERDRKMTILLTPFMSCSAKLPIYGFFTMAFFSEYRSLVMMSLYLFGIMVGIISAFLMKKTVFTGEPVPFVMELPNYRCPSIRNVLMIMWEEAKGFMTKAFTVVFLATVIIWFLQSFDTRLNPVENSAASLLGFIGYIGAPIFLPLGIDDWRTCIALITGVMSKESVISTLTVLTGGEGAGMVDAVRGMFTNLSAYTFLIFTLLYTPCVAAISTVRRELNSNWATVGFVVYQCAVAWLAAFAVYHVGLILGLQ